MDQLAKKGRIREEMLSDIIRAILIATKKPAGGKWEPDPRITKLLA